MLHEGEKQKKYLLAAAAVAFAAVVGFSLWSEAKSYGIQQKIDENSAKIAKLEQKLKEQSRVAQSGSFLERIKAELDAIEGTQIYWSRILEKMDTTIPKREGGESTVTLHAYSGGEDGKLIMNASTLAGAPEPFADIAGFIRAFTTEESFSGVFVPTITKSLTPEGATVFNFSTNLSYTPQQ